MCEIGWHRERIVFTGEVFDAEDPIPMAMPDQFEPEEDSAWQ